MGIERYETRYGTVYRMVGGCKDDWKNLATSNFYRKDSGVIRLRSRRLPVKMQRPALQAFRQAEAKVGHEIVVTGSLRTCELQAALYRSDPNRYAQPSEGVHCQGLAVDVSTEQPDLTTGIRKAMTLCGFKQSRSDEPWHFSFHVSA